MPLVVQPLWSGSWSCSSKEAEEEEEEESSLQVSVVVVLSLSLLWAVGRKGGRASSGLSRSDHAAASRSSITSSSPCGVLAPLPLPLWGGEEEGADATPRRCRRTSDFHRDWRGKRGGRNERGGGERLPWSGVGC
jgi:hypothetical protein